jgi:hypothetical protein
MSRGIPLNGECLDELISYLSMWVLLLSDFNKSEFFTTQWGFASSLGRSPRFGRNGKIPKSALRAQNICSPTRRCESGTAQQIKFDP